MNLTITHKLSLSNIFLVLMSAGIVGGIFHSKTKNILVDKALKHIALDVQEAGSSLLQLVNSHDQDVLFLASTPPFQGMIRARSGGGVDKKDNTRYSKWVSRLETIFESLLERKEKYRMIRFIDKHGHELVSVRREGLKIVRVNSEKLQDKSHRPYVRETLKLSLGQVYLSEINLNREYGKVVIPHEEVFRIATPIFDERNNESAGFVIVTFEIGKELRKIQNRVNHTGENIIYITNDHGGYLLHPNKEMTYGFDLGKRYRIQEDIPQLSEQFLPENNNEHLTLLPGDTGKQNVVNFTKINFDSNQPERFISVVMTQNHEKIIAETSKLLNEITMWTFLLALSGAALAVLISIRITRPIQHMTQAIDEFNKSHTLITNLPVTSNDEVGILARSFRDMILQVTQSRSKLENLNASLESKVAVRTEDLNKALIEAEKANRTKSEFLSRMSHELRTPMNAILGFGQVLELDADELNVEQQTNIKEILEAGYHLLDLINDVLDLAKIESGKIEISMANIGLNDAISQSIALIQTQASSRNIELIDNISDKDYQVHADMVRLKQVLVNLLSNAVKYNKESGKIILDSELLDEHHLRIRITDHGEGLREEDIAKLFTPFERLDNKNNVEGVGIGLVITKYMIELMNGNIGVESTKGQGSTFWIDLESVDRLTINT